MRIHAHLEAAQGYLVCARQGPERFDVDKDGAR